MMEDRRNVEMNRRLLDAFSVVHVKEQDPLSYKMNFWKGDGVK